MNKLRWTTTSEQNNRGFDVQRSTDGVSYNSIGFVNSLAAGGNSNDNLNYSFVDNAPAGNKQYYRLRQLDFNGGTKLSNVILIKGEKPMILTIDGLYPNPANSLVNVQVAAPIRDKVTLAVVDMAGRTVIQKIITLETGSNTIPVDISQLTSGSYMVKLVCSGNCETAVGRFVKQ
ncbi:MAG: T9SS type A sorting domain-containing protein [Chitinophagaceae bacterium]